ncbi:Ion-translocating oxidoreductase complex subunit E [Frankliniella fusca]|uniref:Ion-translocating oxidoreductase complex subunit E n=1 Tax=Frankliniella fusca TaxID=407009 RepID=A0AAE1GR79_9NEOP|nr:Ion-translocating oxidoreductase complex subunit E [Frankliniella fusca]
MESAGPGEDFPLASGHIAKAVRPLNPRVLHTESVRSSAGPGIVVYAILLGDFNLAISIIREYLQEKVLC